MGIPKNDLFGLFWPGYRLFWSGYWQGELKLKGPSAKMAFLSMYTITKDLKLKDVLMGIPQRMIY